MSGSAGSRSSIYIVTVEWNGELAGKIASKHGITWNEMPEAVQWPARPRRAAWVEPTTGDPRGRRLVVERVTAAGRVLRVILYPTSDGDGTWRLATAVPVT